MKKPLLLLLIAIGALAATFAATLASFNDTVTSEDNTFSAGALLLSVDGECGVNEAPAYRNRGGATCDVGAVFAETSWKPGDSDSHAFAVRNDGNMAGTLSATTTPTYPAGCGAANWTISTSPFDAALGVGESTAVTVTVSLNSSAQTECQGSTLSLDIAFSLNQ